MISQKCPKCLSNRVRRGYRPTPIWSKILFRYNLLCDNCNWEFTGFAVPGTVSAKPTKKTKKNISERKEESSDDASSDKSEPDQHDTPNSDESESNQQNVSPEMVVPIGNLARKKTKARKKV